MLRKIRALIQPWMELRLQKSITAIHNIIWYLNPLGKWNAKARTIERLKWMYVIPEQFSLSVLFSRYDLIKRTKISFSLTQYFTLRPHSNNTSMGDRTFYDLYTLESMLRLRHSTEDVMSSFQLDATAGGAFWCYMLSLCVVALNNSVPLFIFHIPKSQEMRIQNVHTYYILTTTHTHTVTFTHDSCDCFGR